MKTKKILIFVLTLVILLESFTVLSLAKDLDLSKNIEILNFVDDLADKEGEDEEKLDGDTELSEDKNLSDDDSLAEDEKELDDDNLSDDTDHEEDVKSQNLGEYIVVPALLNFRKEPSTESEVVEILEQGTKLNIEKIEDGWGMAVYNGKTGWLMMEYIEYIEYLDKYSVEWKLISVSENHGEIDWDKVKNDGVDAAILQIAYNDIEKNEIIEDAQFAKNYKSLLESKIHAGAVFVSAASNVNEAKAEAKWLVEKLKKDNLKLDMPIFVDIRGLANLNLSKEITTAIVEEFAGYLLENSYYPGVYLSAAMVDKNIDMLKLVDFAIWLEDISANISYKARVNVWNNSHKTKINGINSNVSSSTSYTNFRKLIEDNAYNNIEFIGEHILGDWEVLAKSTCTSYGLEVVNCLHCEIILKSRILPLEEHDYNTWEIIRNSTETEEGEIEFRCEKCGQIVGNEYIPALNPTHAHRHGDWIETFAPDCANYGERAIKCKDCDKLLVTEILAPLEHEPGEWLIEEPTCTENGKRILYCKNCEMQLAFELLSATGHEVKEWTVDKEPTNSEPGKKSGKCEICGEIIVEDIPKLKPLLKGDVNFDGKITAADARLILRYSASLETYTEDEKIIADINDDGKVTAADARLALRVAAKLD